MQMLKSKVAVVLGGTSAIGARIALDMARAGAEVVVVGRDEHRGRTALARLRADCPESEFVFMSADLRDAEQCDRIYGCAIDALGGIDIMVHSVPPVVLGGRFSDVDRTRVSLESGDGGSGVFNCCHRVLPHLRARGGGAILTFASDAGRVASRGQALVGATQSAIMQFTRALALELAPEGIRVNCISPSYVRDTPVFERLMSRPERAASVSRAASRAGLGLPGPEDIAPMAVFLCSPHASKITGQIISINGGLTAA